MPVYVRWQWKEETKSFLVIFYFIDDNSKTNLRFRPKVTWTVRDAFTMIEVPRERIDFSTEPVMTWAPNHFEIAFLGDVLRYANIIDGLNETKKRALRPMLEIQDKLKAPHDLKDLDFYEVLKYAKNTPTFMMISDEGADGWFIACTLNSEYIEFLRKMIEPYQRVRV
jgi:hypothetical protein